MENQENSFQVTGVKPEDGFVPYAQIQSGNLQYQKKIRFYGTAGRAVRYSRDLRKGKIFVVTVCSILLLASLLCLHSEPILGLFCFFFTLYAMYIGLKRIREQARVTHEDVDLSPREIREEVQELKEQVKTGGKLASDLAFPGESVRSFRKMTRITAVGSTIAVGILFSVTVSPILGIVLAIVLGLGWAGFSFLADLMIRSLKGKDRKGPEEHS